MAEPTYEELKARVAELERKDGRSGNLEFKVGEKGGVSVYGLGRFPVTLYYEQWVRHLDAGQEPRAFLEKNKVTPANAPRLCFLHSVGSRNGKQHCLKRCGMFPFWKMAHTKA
jgi:hypothetical protein